MPLDISFESNLREWTASLTDVQMRQVPFATAKALTDTARFDVKPAIERRVGDAFDRPVDFTRRGVGYLPANKTGLVSRVFMKDIQAGYLKLEETGGVRTPKRRAIPIPIGQPTDGHGNLPRGAIQTLLARADVFSGVVNGKAGIWQRTPRGPKLLVLWASRATYKPIFRFAETAYASAELNFPRRFEAALSQAFATAR